VSAAVLYAAVVAYVATRHPPIAIVAVLLGAVGALMLLFVLVQRVAELLPWSLALVGIAYTIAILARGSVVDEGAPLVGVALLLCAELATWSLDERRAIAAERAVVVARATALAVLALAGLGVGALVLALAAAPVGGGLAWTALGAAAAVLVVAIAARR
jgi:hypothetical protein